MNIFVLDKTPSVAATYHVDKHVVKMCLETAQILCSVRHKLGDTNIPYRLTHKNHPCVLWASQSNANYNWLISLGKSLCQEYTYRYGKTHKCEAVIKECEKELPFATTVNIGNFPLYNYCTAFAQAMPAEYKHEDAVIAYRNYYRLDKMHSIQCKWTKRQQPEWI